MNVQGKNRNAGNFLGPCESKILQTFRNDNLFLSFTHSHHLSVLYLFSVKVTML